MERLSNEVPGPSLKPAISPRVHLSLTVAYTTLYGLLFLIVYVQLWMIWYYRHRRFSYQSVFLYLCLIWAGLRTTLFSFYFTESGTTLANNLNVFANWLLYCGPVCLQYVTLCLLVIFFAQVLFRSMPQTEVKKYRYPLFTGVGFSLLVFLAVDITCEIIIQQYDKASSSPPWSISTIRVIVSGTLFISVGIILAICVHQISKVSSSSVIIETKGLKVCQARTVAILVILLYTSRAIYNFLAITKSLNSFLSFGYGWINVSDQADLADLNQGLAYISFGIVLFVWEFLPTFIVVMFFRVHKPSGPKQPTRFIPPPNTNSSYFFDNPRRYDSDEDFSSRLLEPNLDNSSVNSSVVYGSLPNPTLPHQSNVDVAPPLASSYYSGSPGLPPVETFYDGT